MLPMEQGSPNTVPSDHWTQQVLLRVAALRRELSDLERIIQDCIPSGRNARSQTNTIASLGQDDWRRREFRSFEDARRGLTPQQWTLVYLLYREGRSQASAASQLGIKASGVSALLGRARRARDTRLAELRKERFQLSQSGAKAWNIAQTSGGLSEGPDAWAPRKAPR